MKPQVLRTIIVDDEPLARQRLRDLLGGEANVEIIGECNDGPSAVEAIRKLQPDLVFLDVQMPGLDGFEVLEALDSENLPAVIFSTAHDSHAIRAFEVNAIDYLYKPFPLERLVQALKKVRDRVTSRTGDPNLASLLMQLRGGGESGFVVVRSGNRIVFVRSHEIDHIESAGNYVVIHCGEERHVVRETLTSLAKRLEPSGFMRISRTAIINLDRIRELEVVDAGQYRVILKSGIRCDMTCPLRELETRLKLHPPSTPPSSPT
jgi:two-component system LytT family response regulator